MKQLKELKAILHSKRANIYYLEMCRVMQKDGRVLYLTETKNHNQYWNIPIANTTVVLLGIGTSITQAAMRMLSSAGVMIGFSGSGGTPLIASNEIEWLSPQSEYRPTQYIQGWMSFWFDDNKRLRELSNQLRDEKEGALSELNRQKIIAHGRVNELTDESNVKIAHLENMILESKERYKAHEE